MTFKKFAKKVDLSEEELIDVLTENGYLKKSGEPKAKFIEEGLFNDDGEIEDVNSLKDIIKDLFSEDEEDENDDENEEEEVEVKSSKKSSKKSKDEEDDDDDLEDDPDDESDDNENEEEELEYSDMVDMLEDWEFESRDEVADLIKMLTDKLVELD